MKRFFFPLTVAIVLMLTMAVAQAEDTIQRGPAAAFVDADGDGINDNAPDHDGDGIVNHLDPDYKPLGLGYGRGPSGQFVDENGDGINDLAPDDDGDGVPNGQDPDYVRGSGRGNGYGRSVTMGRGRWGGWGTQGRFQAFVDADGDGINDNARDDDNNGVINCLDDDFSRPAIGRGQMRGRQGNGRFGKEVSH